jgi:hypothetical protein
MISGGTRGTLDVSEAPSLFGECFDAMARHAGAWPDDAVAYAVEVVGGGNDPMVLITGEVPVGVKRDGSPKFGAKQVRYRAGVKLSEYRAALPKQGAE